MNKKCEKTEDLRRIKMYDSYLTYVGQVEGICR